ncbi:NAD(P)-binding domain-containing protein [Alcaligenaceae bacterium]|nr:NAD(P)-binding domain-containing protein [Alcaligenaceae bacterium]
MQELFKRASEQQTALRAALSNADPVPSLLVLAHLTQDLTLLEQAAPYIAGGWNYQQHVPESIRQTAQNRLVDVLKEYAEQNKPLPELPSDETLQRMMSAAVGTQVPSEYIPMFIEELRIGPQDTRTIRWKDGSPPSAISENFQVVVVGAGIAGICAGVRLKQAGVPFVILERHHAPGGTWIENRYPGCGVDTPSHFYSYSFFPNKKWSRYFCRQSEIQDYLARVVTEFGLEEHIRYGTEVFEAKYETSAGMWTVNHRREGIEKILRCNVMITAAGHNVPSLPKLAGIDSFKGPVLHTACWNEGVLLEGKSVALVGTGASGMQVGPAIVDTVERLTIFQRTPHWAMGNPNYHKQVSSENIWCFENIPLFEMWHRFLIFWAASDMVHRQLVIDPKWHLPDLSLNADNHKLRETIIAYMREELGGDEELLRKCTPSYPPYGKRLLRDNKWFSMLRRKDVELISDGISHITPDGIVTSSGKLHKADVLIMATGFSASKLLWPMHITGRHGRSIRDVWGDDDPRAYKGVAVSGFPNFFVLAGPNTVLSHGGSAIFQIECQVAYVLQAIRHMIEGGYQSVEVREDVHDDYNRLIDSKHEHMVWKHPGVTSWYKNKHNRVTMTSPWRLVDFWAITREFDETGYLCKTHQREDALSDIDG